MATGSEVQLAVAAHEELAAAGIRSRVVSLPSFELFDEQPAAYRDEVLPPRVTARVGVEAGIRQCWDKYLGARGRICRPRHVRCLRPLPGNLQHRGLTAEADRRKMLENSSEDSHTIRTGHSVISFNSNLDPSTLPSVS